MIIPQSVRVPLLLVVFLFLLGFSLMSRPLYAQTPVHSPIITGLSTTNGWPNLEVYIYGEYIATTTEVYFNSTPAADFSYNIAGFIVALVPDTATTGPISVVTPAGTAFSANSFTITTRPPALNFGLFAFHSSHDDSFGAGDIYSIWANSTNRQRLTTTAMKDDWPTISRNGDMILFTSQRDSDPGEIYSMAEDGSLQTRLTNSPSEDSFAAISPDGALIAYTEVSTTTGISQIVVMNADGSSPQPILSGETDLTPAFTPDGKIVFWSMRGFTPGYYIMDADGTNVSPLFASPGYDLPIGRPCIVPDGDHLYIYTTFGISNEIDIYRIRIDGYAFTSDAARLTVSPDYNGDPCLSPDGKWIGYISDSHGLMNIKAMRLNGTDPTWITLDDFGYLQPSWAPINGLPPISLTDDSVNLLEDSSVSLPPDTILLNDSFDNTHPVTVTLTTPPAHGTITLYTDGAFDYTPAPNYFGVDTFQYSLTDFYGQHAPSPAKVTLNIKPVNDAPSFTLGLTVIAPRNSGSQSLPKWVTKISAGPNETQGLTFIVAANSPDLFDIQPSIDSSGNLSFTPKVGMIGSSTVKVQLQDDGGRDDGGVDISLESQFTIKIQNERIPTARADAYIMDEDDLIPLEPSPSTGVLANDSAAGGVAVLVRNPLHGILTLRGDGSFTYTPNLNYFGTDSFYYRVVSGINSSPSTLVSITIKPVNDAPVAEARELITVPNFILSGRLHATDVDSRRLTYRLISTPINNHIELTSTGLFHLTSNTVLGDDSFTFVANDGMVDSAPETVLVHVLVRPTQVRLTITPPYTSDTDIQLSAEVDGAPAGYPVEYKFVVHYFNGRGTYSTPEILFDGGAAFSSSPTRIWHPTVPRPYRVTVYARSVGAPDGVSTTTRVVVVTSNLTALSGPRIPRTVPFFSNGVILPIDYVGIPGTVEFFYTITHTSRPIPVVVKYGWTMDEALLWYPSDPGMYTLTVYAREIDVDTLYSFRLIKNILVFYPEYYGK